MRVADLLAAKGNKVVTIRPDATVTLAVHELRAHGIGALVVSGDGTTVEGVLSERDIVLALAERRGDVMGLRVADVMTRGVTTCGPEDHITRVMAEMTQRRIRHLPVVERGRLRGIVSIGDVVKSRLDEMVLEASVLRDAYLAAH
jgi:CBS domain-containing protein